ncbi:MAG: hypothetical protein HY706_06815 [Candidatus Hydrogenedentes bacterium]|nr:hypothetical protein [Candidatus Hydrogenedentota bacterium]
MSLAEYNRSDVSEREPSHEGMFDAQLAFPAPLGETLRPIQSILKRDGREVSFEKPKIVDAIFRAAEAVGNADRDRAESLASGVSIYLMKNVKTRPPTVEQVQDAVERVLIEMGERTTALEYIRYRERRARLRKLRSQDVHTFLQEMESAERAQEIGETPPALSLFVRTSDETLATWDRDRIVQALARETGIEPRIAAIIAQEVEQQLLHAKVRILTAPLVRELVDAKLVEYGFEEYRRKHMRLGLPLFDAEQIICAPNAGVPGSKNSPRRTDVALAERVKREYALAQVFSQRVTDAHLAGDIHLHGLGRIDRIHSLNVSREYFEGASADDSSFIGVKSVDSVLARAFTDLGRLQELASECITLEHPQRWLVPYLAGLSERELRRAAEVFVLECAARSIASRDSGASLEIRLAWESQHFSIEERRQHQLQYTAQRFVWALFEVFRKAETFLHEQRHPHVLLQVSPGLSREPGHERFLELACEVALRQPVITFDFVRNDSLIDESSTAPCIHEVTLNLPRLAFRVSNEHEVRTEIERTLEVVTAAHLEKKDFVAKLAALGELGPLQPLTRPVNGLPLLNLEPASYLVGIIGLDECVRYLCGAGLHESGDALALGLRLIGYVQDVCENFGAQQGLRLVPAHTNDPMVARRLAMLDARNFPLAAASVLTASASEASLSYTLGGRLSDAFAGSAFECALLEGRCQELVPLAATTEVTLAESDTSKESAADFLQKVFHRTHCRRLRFRASRS